MINMDQKIVILHDAVDKSQYNLASILATELSSRDWLDIHQALQTALPELDITQFERSTTLGKMVDNEALLQHVATELNGRIVQNYIMVALSKERKEENLAPLADRQTRSSFQINLHNGQPMIMPSLVNERLVLAAQERAQTEIAQNDKPILTFIENLYGKDSGISSTKAEVTELTETIATLTNNISLDSLDDVTVLRSENAHKDKRLEQQRQHLDAISREADQRQLEAETRQKAATEKIQSLTAKINATNKEHEEITESLLSKIETLQMKNDALTDNQHNMTIKIQDLKDEIAVQENKITRAEVLSLQRAQDDRTWNQELPKPKINFASETGTADHRDLPIAPKDRLLMPPPPPRTKKSNVQQTLRCTADRVQRTKSEPSLSKRFLESTAAKGQDPATHERQGLFLDDQLVTPVRNATRPTRISRLNVETPTRAQLNVMDGLADEPEPTVRVETGDPQPGNRLENAKKLMGKPWLLQPKHFGLQVWNPDHTSITEHLDAVQMCIAEARELGASEANLIRLLMKTLPESFGYMNRFIPKNSQKKYEDFANEVAAALEVRQEQQMGEFFTTTRKSGESILAYFQRVLTLYKASNGLTGDEWMEDKSHVTAVYAKLNASLYRDIRDELRRRVEADIAKKTLTINKLKRHMVDLNRLGLNERNFASEKPRITSIESVEKKEEKRYQEKSEEGQKKESAQTCWACGETGHFKAQCTADKRDNKVESSGTTSNPTWRQPRGQWVQRRGGFRNNYSQNRNFRPNYRFNRGFQRGGFRAFRGRQSYGYNRGNTAEGAKTKEEKQD